MGCLDFSIRILSEKIDCSVKALDLLNIYSDLLNTNITIDNSNKGLKPTINSIIKDILNIENNPLNNLNIDTESLGGIKIDNTYIPSNDKTIYISNKILDRIKIDLKDYSVDIDNIIFDSIEIDNTIYNIKTITITNTIKGRLSIHQSMVCNINDYILLISEDDELIIDESGNFYIEISEN